MEVNISEIRYIMEVITLEEMIVLHSNTIGRGLSRLLAICLISAFLIGMAAGGAMASESFQWYVPNPTTLEQMEQMQIIGRQLQDKLERLHTQYRGQLSAFANFYYNCLFDHMADLHVDDDWEKFGAALDGCDSAEAFAALLDMPFLGITQAHEGYLPPEQILEVARDILKSAKSEGFFDRMLAIPKTCYDEYGEAWVVWLASPDDSQHAYMRFLRDGVLMEYYYYVSVHGYED